MRSRSTRKASLEKWEFKTEFLQNGAVRHYDGTSSTALEWQRLQQGALGRGAYGEVWAQECVTEGKVRAVKQIPKAHRSFTERELEALVAFSTTSDSRFQEYRRYLVQFFGWFQSPNDIFIAMELVPHRSLQEYVRQVAFVEIEAATIIVQTARALRLIHGMGFAHRDLKPANILVASREPVWWVKVADFGIAKSTQGTQLNTSMTGTLEYMAPELFEENTPSSQSYSPAVDIWSLGAVIFCLFTQAPPFKNLPAAWKFANGYAPFPEEKLAQFSPGVLALVLKTMKGDPNQRPAPKELLEDAWLQPHGRYVDRVFGASVYNFDDQKQQGESQQRSWNGAASNRWTEAAQGPRSQQQTIRPHVPASQAPAFNGPASNAWSFMGSRTATSAPDPTHQQTFRPYNPTSESTFRPFVPAPQAGNEGMTSRLDALDHGLGTPASVLGLHGTNLPPSHRPGTPEQWFPNGTALPSANGPDQTMNQLPEGMSKVGVKRGSAFLPDESGGMPSVGEKPDRKAPNRAKTSGNNPKPTAGPPPGHMQTAVVKNPRFPKCTQEDCPACQNDWKSNQCLRCGWEFKHSKDQSEHLQLFGHFVDIQTHQPEYYNMKTHEWVPIQPKRRGKPVGSDRPRPTAPRPKDSQARNPSYPNCTQQDCQVCLNDWTSDQCFRCGQLFENSRDRYKHLDLFNHFVDIKTHQPEYYNWKKNEWVPIRPKQKGNVRHVPSSVGNNNRLSENAGLLSKSHKESQTQLRPGWVMNKFTGRPEPNRDHVCLKCLKNFSDSRELHQHLVERRHWV